MTSKTSIPTQILEFYSLNKQQPQKLQSASTEGGRSITLTNTPTERYALTQFIYLCLELGIRDIT